MTHYIYKGRRSTNKPKGLAHLGHEGKKKKSHMSLKCYTSVRSLQRVPALTYCVPERLE